MNEKNRKRIEQRLHEERRRVAEALAEIDDRFADLVPDSDGDLSKYPFHLADEGTDTMEQEKDALLATQEGRIFAAIDDALRTLYHEPESFGECESCGEEISVERMELVPWTRHCVECKRDAEQSATGEVDVA